MTSTRPVDRYRSLRVLAAIAGLSAALGACTFTGEEVVTASVPNDYRLRHPIAVQEANRSNVVFVGHARGGLTAPQRTTCSGWGRHRALAKARAIVADVPELKAAAN